MHVCGVAAWALARSPSLCNVGGLHLKLCAWSLLNPDVCCCLFFVHNDNNNVHCSLSTVHRPLQASILIQLTGLCKFMGGLFGAYVMAVDMKCTHGLPKPNLIGNWLRIGCADETCLQLF